MAIIQREQASPIMYRVDTLLEMISCLLNFRFKYMIPHLNIIISPFKISKIALKCIFETATYR